MSGLFRLLDGNVDPGVYTWTSAATAAEVRAVVEPAAWRFVELDTGRAGDKNEFLAQCKHSFGFPDWVGANFDALADALTDVRAPGPGGVLVLWRGWQRLAHHHPHVFSMALSVFAGRVAFRPGGPFAVLLQTPEPTSLELVNLDSLTG